MTNEERASVLTDAVEADLHMTFDGFRKRSFGAILAAALDEAERRGAQSERELLLRLGGLLAKGLSHEVAQLGAGAILGFIDERRSCAPAPETQYGPGKSSLWTTPVGSVPELEAELDRITIERNQAWKDAEDVEAMNKTLRKEILKAIVEAGKINGAIYVGWEKRSLERLKALGFDFCESGEPAPVDPVREAATALVDAWKRTGSLAFGGPEITALALALEKAGKR